LQLSVTFDLLKSDEQVIEYLKAGNNTMLVLGYTEHSFRHAYRTADTAARILTELGYPSETAELAKIAGLMHDIGNMMGRTFHAASGAEIARSILERHGMSYAGIGTVCGAVGNHDETVGKPVSAVSAALIIADKSDVHRSRVQETDMDKILADIHDRVNYAVNRAEIMTVGSENGYSISLCLDIDTAFTPVMDYFEIFLSRMLMCRRAAAFLGAGFNLVINNHRIM
jgi:hypothetical protein